MKVPVVIEGVRLRLRRSTPADAPALYAAVNDAEAMRFMDWPLPKAEAETRAYLEGCAARWDAGSEHHWVIETRADAAVRGAIACRIKGHAADIGCLLARTSWGQGYGREAASLLVGWLRRQPQIVRIWATTDVDHTRSVALLEHVGLGREGLLKKATVRPQLGRTPRDTLVFGWARDAAPSG